MNNYSPVYRNWLIFVRDASSNNNNQSVFHLCCSLVNNATRTNNYIESTPPRRTNINSCTRDIGRKGTSVAVRFPREHQQRDSSKGRYRFENRSKGQMSLDTGTPDNSPRESRTKRREASTWYTLEQYYENSRVCSLVDLQKSFITCRDGRHGCFGCEIGRAHV